MVILNRYTTPRLIYKLDDAECKANTLNAADGIIRIAAKKWLHLPMSTCNGLLYLRKRDGGLGILRLEKFIPSIQVRRMQRIANSSDGIIGDIMRTPAGKEKLKKTMGNGWRN